MCVFQTLRQHRRQVVIEGRTLGRRPCTAARKIAHGGAKEEGGKGGAASSGGVPLLLGWFSPEKADMMVWMGVMPLVSACGSSCIDRKEHSYVL